MLTERSCVMVGTVFEMVTLACDLALGCRETAAPRLRSRPLRTARMSAAC